MDVRPIAPEEVEEFLAAGAAAFHGDLQPHQRDRWGATLEPPRSYAAFDGGAIVGTAGAFTRTMTLPGAGPVPAAHVTSVGVLPTHRRRGVLRRLLGEVHAAAPEAWAVLWASEASIYGRFGYGPAARYAELAVDTTRAAFREDAPPAAPVRLTPAADAREELAAVYDRVLPERPGMPDREAPGWWRRVLLDPEADRDGASSLRAALLEDGRGYALYRVKPGWSSTGPTHTCDVVELVAVDPAARAALWRFLCSLDLVRKVTWDGAPADEVLPHLLADRRAVTITTLDALWVGLLDVPRALASRGYAAPVDLVLELTSPPTREPVRLRAGADGEAVCDPAPHAPADLRLGAEALGSTLLGGTTAAELHAAGRIEELRPGAVTEMARAFRADLEPWCPEVF